MQPIADRAAQYMALIDAIADARNRGDEEVRADAEWALTRLLQGEPVQLPDDFKVAQSGERE